MTATGPATAARTQTTLVRALAEAATTTDAADAALRLIGETYGWDVGILWIADPQEGLLRYRHGWTRAPDAAGDFLDLSRRLTFARGVGLPGRAWAADAPLAVPHLDRDPDYQRPVAARSARLESAVAFAARARAAVQGVVELYAGDLRRPDPVQLDALRMAGQQLGQFLARMSVEERLQESEELSASIVNAALDCIITMDHEGHVVDFNPAAQATFGLGRDEVVGRLLAETIIPPEFREAHQRALSRFVETGTASILNRRLELTAIRSGGERFPVELTVTRVGDRWPPLFAGFVRDITERQASQQELAQLLEREHAARVRAEKAEQRARQVSEALQRSLLPPHLPVIPGVALGAAYRAGAEGSAVGGDFYDVYPLDESCWALTIGDVRGKGPAAAAISGLARHTLRAAAVREAEPAAVLRALNEALLREGRDDFCTVVFGVLRLGARGPTLCLAVGGHPRPLLLDAQGAVREVGIAGTLLGAIPDPHLRAEEIALRPGETILLYTDGVTEARCADGRFGEVRLRRLLADLKGRGAAEVAARVDQEVAGAASGNHGRDDLAVLSLRVEGP